MLQVTLIVGSGPLTEKTTSSAIELVNQGTIGIQSYVQSVLLYATFLPVMSPYVQWICQIAYVIFDNISSSVEIANVCHCLCFALYGT